MEYDVYKIFIIEKNICLFILIILWYSSSNFLVVIFKVSFGYRRIIFHLDILIVKFAPIYIEQFIHQSFVHSKRVLYNLLTTWIQVLTALECWNNLCGLNFRCWCDANITRATYITYVFAIHIYLIILIETHY